MLSLLCITDTGSRWATITAAAEASVRVPNDVIRVGYLVELFNTISNLQINTMKSGFLMKTVVAFFVPKVTISG